MGGGDLQIVTWCDMLGGGSALCVTFVGDWYIQEFFLWNPKFRSVKILLNKLRDQRLLNLIYLNFLCILFDQLAYLHEWSHTATHMRRTNTPLTPLDECARDCCILVPTRDPHSVRASYRARLLSGELLLPLTLHFYILEFKKLQNFYYNEVNRRFLLFSDTFTKFWARYFINKIYDENVNS